MDNQYKVDKLVFNKIVQSVKDNENVREEIFKLLRDKYKLNPFDSMVALIGMCITIVDTIPIPFESFYYLVDTMFGNFHQKGIKCKECESDSEIEDFLNENPDLSKNRVLN
jgi:hypothetical protein